MLPAPEMMFRMLAWTTEYGLDPREEIPLLVKLIVDETFADFVLGPAIQAKPDQKKVQDQAFWVLLQVDLDLGFMNLPRLATAKMDLDWCPRLNSWSSNSLSDAVILCFGMRIKEPRMRLHVALDLDGFSWWKCMKPQVKICAARNMVQILALF